MLYSDWITAVCDELNYDAQLTNAASATPTSVTAFNNMIPRAIDYTENRIQRDLDLLATIKTAITGVMTPNSRLQWLPQLNLPIPSQVPSLIGTPIQPGAILTAVQGSQNINVYWPNHGIAQGQNVSLVQPVPVGGLTLGGVFNAVAILDQNNFTIIAPTAATSSGPAAVMGNGIYIVCTQIRPIINGVKQSPMEFVTRDYLDYVWPSDASVGANIPPVQWTVNDQASVLLGPAPDQAYGFETVGTMRFPQLSAANYVNFLTTQFPDLYLAASLVFFFGYQRDFGAQGEDPKTAQSWENQYQTLLKSAQTEETRKRLGNMFPSPTNPAPVAAG